MGKTRADQLVLGSLLWRVVWFSLSFTHGRLARAAKLVATGYCDRVCVVFHLFLLRCAL